MYQPVGKKIFRHYFVGVPHGIVEAAVRRAVKTKASLRLQLLMTFLLGGGGEELEASASK